MKPTTTTTTAWHARAGERRATASCGRVLLKAGGKFSALELVKMARHNFAGLLTAAKNSVGWKSARPCDRATIEAALSPSATREINTLEDLRKLPAADLKKLSAVDRLEVLTGARIEGPETFRPAPLPGEVRVTNIVGAPSSVQPVAALPSLPASVNRFTASPAKNISAQVPGGTAPPQTVSAGRNPAGRSLPSMTYPEAVATWQTTLAGYSESQRAVKLKELGAVRTSKGEAAAIAFMVSDAEHRVTREQSDMRVDDCEYRTINNKWQSWLKQWCGSPYRKRLDAMLETVRTQGRAVAMKVMQRDLSTQ